MKKGCAIPIVALLSLLFLVVVVAAVAGFFLLQGPAAPPLVFINSPHDGERVAVGQETVIHATARGEQKIKRVELWVDGKLLDGQSTNIAAGLTTFPLVVNWRPPISGTHTLIARALNVQGRQGQASIDVRAVQSGDRDNDNMPDALDGCPDQPGLTTNNGCPVPTLGDRDGDGAPESSDLCPDQAGTLLAQGCPDADGDAVADASDACPAQVGSAEVSGCPAPGDADGDDVDNPTDLIPSEGGAVDAGSAPPPGGGADALGDGAADVQELPADPAGDLLGRLFFRAYVMTPAEVQALEFQVTHDYTRVYCYASLAGSAEERIGPFAPLGARKWDIADYLGPLHSRTLFVPSGQPLQVRVECSGIVAGSAAPSPGGGIGEGGGEEAYFDLGSISRSHTVGTATTVEETVDSSGGSAGRSFRVKYRVCTPSCTPSTLPAPMIRLTHVSDVNMLWWEWPGETYDISGFKIYMNGNDMFSRPPGSTLYRFSGMPPCGQRFDVQMTAYRGNPGHPDAESPLSNIQSWEGAPCQRTVSVSFRRLETGDLHDNDDWGDVGPLFGSFYVGDDHRRFESNYRLEVRERSHSISAFFPRTDFAVDLDPADSLYIGATIMDRDPGRNPNDTIFDFEEIIQSGELVTGEHRLTGRGGSAVVVYITVMPGL